MQDVWTKIEPYVRALLRLTAALLSAVWTVIRPPLMFVLQVLAALILLFEEWGWKPLSDLLAQLSRFKPWARFEQWIALLPPYGALAVFALPAVVLFPLKLVSVWLLANGFYAWAGALFIAAKIASTAFLARIFLLTKPALMRIGWFARAYNWVMPWKTAIFSAIRASFAWRYGRMLKNAVRLEAKQAYARWKPWLTARWQELAPQVSAWLSTAPQRLKLAWRVWRPRASAEIARWRTALRRTWERLIGIA